MLKDLFVVIHHYDKYFFSDMNKITDPRAQSYITYPLEVMLLTRIMAYCCHIKSMAQMNEDFNEEYAINNISKICGIQLKNLPHGDTINDLFKRLDINELRKFLTSIIKHMINSRFFEKYRYDNKYYQLVIDGTQLYSFDKKHVEKCLTRTHADGSTTYHTAALCAYLIIGDGLLLPIDFEMIENEKINTEKQDCEINAAKRLLKRIKKAYPRLEILLSGDALYACEPIMSICKKNHWHYIIRFKEGRIGTKAEEFKEMKSGSYTTKTEKEVILHGKKIKKEYEYVNEIEYGEWRINILEIKERERKFTFITDMEINERNEEEIGKHGRKRWKIENKGFNDEKNHGYGLTHAYSYDENAIKCHYILLLISHLFMQLLEHYLKVKGRNEKIQTIGKEMKKAFSCSLLNAQDIVKILLPIQIRIEISY